MKISTYFRSWSLDLNTGEATSRENKLLFLFFLGKKYRRRPSKFEIYDYFVSESHIKYIKNEAKELRSKLKNVNIDVQGKNILDVSGGNGIVLNTFKPFARELVLTEVNDLALGYAREVLKLKTLKFDFDKDNLEKILDKKLVGDNSFPTKFDLILLRACVMFIKDLDLFFVELKKVLAPNGIVYIEKSVWFTLGVALRTQLDDSSYTILRSHKSLENTICRNGFIILNSSIEIDPSMYIFDHDKKIVSRILYLIYENLNIIKFKKNDHLNYRSRFRLRSDFCIKLPK